MNASKKETKKGDAGADPETGDKAERLSAALRDNLKRRKAQKRARQTGEGGADAPPAGRREVE